MLFRSPGIEHRPLAVKALSPNHWTAREFPEDHFFYFFLNKFIYLFLAAFGLRCCAQAFSSCGEWGLLFLAVHGLLIAVASLVAEHRL